MAVRFTYFGGMAVLMEREDGFKILVDPFFTGNPHTAERPENFRDVDVILSTHAADDHFGDAAEIFHNSKAVMIAGRSCRKRLVDSGVFDADRFMGTCYGDQRRFGETLIKTVPAFHGSFFPNERDSGFVSAPPFGFVVQIDRNVSYYHAGDTSIFSDMKLIGELYHPNIMTVGISRIQEGLAMEMSPSEAARAVSWVRPDVVIPTHYPVGSKALEEFKNSMNVFAPYVTICERVGYSFVYEPFSVEYR